MEIIDNYIVTSIIGSGSFGTCYKVKHKSSQQEFVWKAVNYGQMSEEKKESLVSEVNVLSKLKHPNIVRYFNHIIHKKSSTLYITMEYCSGGDLSKVIKNCTKNSQCLDETFIWRVLYQVALALNVCHSQCASIVLHRDIKPANVFLDAENNVKLGDFGLAKILDEKENFTETVVGTPLYMSPELIRNKKYNKKSDIWALGCLIYEISALVAPFSGTNLKNLSLNINEGKFNRIPDIYSDDLQIMIDFLLNIESENRPAVDVVVRHPTVVSKSNKIITSIYKTNKSIENMLVSNLESKFNENLQIRLESVRNREAAIKIREEKLNEKERNLNKREKKIILLERLANEKVARANLYLKRSKEAKINGPIKSHIRLKQEVEDLDTSFSADPGDNSILPTSTKIDEEQIVKPKRFVRSKSERRVHFNAQKVFQSTAEEPIIFKEYNFFHDENIKPPSVDTKPKKKNYFGIGVLKTINNKISQSSSSLGSKSSSTNSTEITKTNSRPMSWSEENKRCAFSLLKLMNNESDKENIHSKITHTKM